MRNFLKMILFSIIIGVCVGFIELFFAMSIKLATDIRNMIYKYLIFIIFLPLLITFYLKYKFKIKEKSLNILFDITSKRNRKIHFFHIIYQYSSTLLSHLFGFSVGKEGVAVLLGGSLANNMFHKSRKYKLYTLCGMASGFSGLFLAPLTGTFFALEITGNMKKRYIKDYLFYILISSYISYFINFLFKQKGIKFNIMHQDLNNKILYITIFISIGCLLLGNLFVKFLNCMIKLNNKINVFVKVFILSVMIGLFIYFLKDGRYASLSMVVLNDIFIDHSFFNYDFIMKLILTVICISIGFQGGEVTPIFVIGSSFASLMSYFDVDLSLVASLGLIGFFCSCTNTFYASIFLSFEMFSYHNIILYIIVVLVVYSFNKNTTIYKNRPTKAFYNIYDFNKGKYYGKNRI